MITTIIFSFDRSFQLELLLDSIVKYDENNLLQLHVIYATSRDEFDLGYSRLLAKYPDIKWHKENRFSHRFVWPLLPFYWHNYFWWIKYKYHRRVNSDFKNKTITILEDSNNEFSMFLTDDSIFFCTIKINKEALELISRNNLSYSFSLRHGKNIFGGNFLESNRMIFWKTTNKHDHPEWRHPFSVDGHVYSTIALKKILRKVIFNNPNTLEGNVACYAKEKKLFIQHLANYKSCLLGFELNRVQTVSNNNNLNISNSTLNKLHLEDYHLHLNYTLTEPHLFRPEVISVTATKENKRITLYEYQ
jgi:hypothetical protein